MNVWLRPADGKIIKKYKAIIVNLIVKFVFIANLFAIFQIK